MRDPRLQKLAKSLLSYSTGVKKGQHVLIRGHVVAKPLLKELIKECYALEAYPYVELWDDEISRDLLLKNSEARAQKLVDWDLQKTNEVDAVISVFGEENDSETSDVSLDIRKMTLQYRKQLSNIIINQKNWVLLNYPTPSLAQKAGMSTEAFEDFLLDVCNVDYAKMHEAMKHLKAYMEKTDRVRIVSPGTDLTFSIKGIPAVICSGQNNIPDGEVFTAPVKDSVNGTITYNIPSPYQGSIFNHVKLTFKDGKIIEATADSHLEHLTSIFDTDEGARYVGEFAIGVNPLIKKPMGDILFDEKIDGSLHFTPGACYEGEADNGNHSAIHWDLVLIQRAEYGGGEIYFDDVLIRKDGRFVVEELIGLNPDQLV